MSIAEAHAQLTAVGARFEMQTVDVRGVPTRVWKNAPNTLRDVFVHLETYAERTCLVYGDERASYAGFMRATLELAQQLRAAGVQPGDRVAIAMRNLPEWPVCMFAATLLGAIVVPCNAWGSGAELEYAISFAGAVVACVDGERLERLAPHLGACPTLRALFITRNDSAQLTAAQLEVHSLDQLIGAAHTWDTLARRALPDVELNADADALIFYTSGTTGWKKYIYWGTRECF